MRYKRILCLLLVLVFLSGYMLFSIYDEVKNKTIDQLNNQQLIHAKLAAKGIERFFDHYFHELGFIANNDHIITFDEPGKSLMKSFYQVYSDQIRAITRVDAKGRIIYTIPYKQEAIGADISYQKHVKEIIRNHRPVISDVFMAVQGYKTVALHVPVFKNDEYRGSLAILVPFDLLAKRYLEDIKIGESGYAWMISREGVELYCPVPGHVGKTIHQTCGEFPTIISMAERMMAGGQGTTTYYFNYIRGETTETLKKHAAYYPIRLGNTFWSLVVSTPESEVLKDLRGFRNKWVLIIAILAVVGLISSYYVIKAWAIISEEAKRRRAERALRESEEKFRLISEQSLMGIHIIQDGVLRYVNDASSQICGYSIEEMMAWEPYGLAKVIHPEDRPFVMEQAKKKEQGHGDVVANHSWRLIAKSGEVKWIESFSKTVSFRDALADFVMMIDITDRKRMEEELLKIHKLESLGVLAGGIAHDFNNFLAAVLGNISLARIILGPEKTEVLDVLEDAEKASHRAKHLTQQLLTFSRGGAPVKEAASLSELLKDSCSFILSGSNVGYELSVPQGLWSVEIDVGQVSQVINNLLINADQAMPKGGTIQVRAKNIAVGDGYALPLREGKYLEISFEDHGTGIRQDHLPLIFDPFFSTKQKGSGLGLATAFSIVKNHEGYITADSEVGVGSTFHLYLPASEKEIVPREMAEIAPVYGEGRVLVMDDEEVVRRLVGKMLDRMGFEVELAGDGREAVELYAGAMESGRPFKAVILDLTVPGGMGGKDAVAELLEMDPDVRAVVSSGYSTDPVMADYRLYGFKGMVAKPYEYEELGRVIEKVISDPGDGAV